MNESRILIAGVGNIFLGDDAFGVEVVQRLAKRALPPEVRVVDFGIRGIDLTYALLDGYESVILVDAVPRGECPGTLYVLEPEIDAADPLDGGIPIIETHSLDPAKVLRLAKAMGGNVDHVLLVGCEPSPIACDDELPTAMSEPVRSAIRPAIELIESLIERLRAAGKKPIIENCNLTKQGEETWLPH